MIITTSFLLKDLKRRRRSSNSFTNVNKIDVCNDGGLTPILNNIFNDDDNVKVSEHASCALANLTEVVDNAMPIDRSSLTTQGERQSMKCIATKIFSTKQRNNNDIKKIVTTSSTSTTTTLKNNKKLDNNLKDALESRFIRFTNKEPMSIVLINHPNTCDDVCNCSDNNFNNVIDLVGKERFKFMLVKHPDLTSNVLNANYLKVRVTKK